LASNACRSPRTSLLNESNSAIKVGKPRQRARKWKAKAFRYILPSLLIVALMAGLAAAAGCGGGGGSDQEAESAIAKLLKVGQSPGTTNQVFVGELPPDLPSGLPEYPGSSLVGSTITTSDAAKTLSVLRETGDPVDKVYAFYEQALDTDPWEIQISSFPAKSAGLQFVNINDANMAGAVIIQSSGDDEGDCLIFVSIQTASGTATSEPFELEPSKPLPRDWPAQVPIYPNATITGTAWGRAEGASEWQISFLAQTTPTDVIDFYRTELTNASFVVTDEAPQNEVSVLSFKNELTAETWNGAVSAQTFADDPSYAQGTVQLSISSGAATQPLATPMPTP